MRIPLKAAALTLAVMACGFAQAGTLDDIRALEAGKKGDAPAMTAAPAGEPASTPQADEHQAQTPRWFMLSDGRRVNLSDWKAVLFMQSTCQYCHKFAPVLARISQRTGLSVFPVSLDGRGDRFYPDVLPATPDVVVEYFQSGMPVATPTLFLTNVNSMETWPLLQGDTPEGDVMARLDEVLRMAADRNADKKKQGGR